MTGPKMTMMDDENVLTKQCGGTFHSTIGADYGLSVASALAVQNEQAFQALCVMPNRLEMPIDQPTLDIPTTNGALWALPGGSAQGTDLGCVLRTGWANARPVRLHSGHVALVRAWRQPSCT